MGSLALADIPWLGWDERCQRLQQAPPGCLLLLDPWRAGAEALGREFIRRSLCLNDGAPGCHCRSCHLLAGGSHPDLLVQDEASKMADLRTLLELVQLTPLLGTKRFVLLLNIDGQHESVLNALLKTLEEPPPHCHFVLTAANRRAVKATILSRAQVLTLPPPSEATALEFVMARRQVARAVALELLESYQHNPFRAATGEALPHPDESLPACVDVLCQRNFAFLAQLERWPAGQLLDYVSRQIGALIRAKQLEWLPPNWPNLASLRREDLDINRLHNLYARLQALRRPSQSQLNRLYAVKALLLEYNLPRNKL